MGNFNKWNRDEDHESDKLTVVLFVSRNKDNKTVPNFTERRNAFTTTKELEQLHHQFQAFVAQGELGEMCRMYVSVNPRSNAKTFKALQHKLLDHEFNLSSLPQRVAALELSKKMLTTQSISNGYSTSTLSKEKIRKNSCKNSSLT